MDARQLDKAGNPEAGNRKTLRSNKQVEHSNKRAKQAMNGLSGTSAGNMDMLGTDTNAMLLEKEVDVKRTEAEVKRTEAEVKRLAEKRLGMQQSQAKFDATTAALEKALTLCERVGDDEMIKTATLKLIVHLQRSMDSEETVGSSSHSGGAASRAMTSPLPSPASAGTVHTASRVLDAERDATPSLPGA